MRLSGLKSEFFDALPAHQKAQVIAILNVIVVIIAAISAIVIR